MALTNAKMLAHQARVFNDSPTETITIAGTNYAGLVMDWNEGNDWEEGGQVKQKTIQMAIERSTIDGAVPAEGTLATLRATSYRIGRVDEDDKASSIVLTLTHTLLT
jgi:hypothetical protein